MPQFTVGIKGTTPTIMHSCRGLDPRNEITKSIKKITAKRGKNKTEEDINNLMRLEWESSIYYDEKLGPYWPAANIEGLLFAGCKKQSLGPKAKIALMVLEDKIALHYAGPREKEKLWADGRFIDYRRVGMPMGKSVMRTRPIFDEWSLEFTLLVDDEIIDVEQARLAVILAGQQVGLSDNRPRYGRFEMVRFDPLEKEKAA